MDIVGAVLVFTFLALLISGPLIMGLRRPPALRRAVRCPEDQAPAAVAVSWEPEQRRMVVIECDHRHARDGSCRRSCEGSLQQAVPELIPTTVMP